MSILLESLCCRVSLNAFILILNKYVIVVEDSFVEDSFVVDVVLEAEHY